MTIAGMNTRVNIWRMETLDDDYVGGASITGTIQYRDIQARFQSLRGEQMVLQQGLETEETYSMLISPGWLDIRERDEVEVSRPLDHIEYGNRFRIIGVHHSDFNRRNPRNYMGLALTRSTRAHAQQ